MKLLLLGYGKMGRAIEKLAVQKKHTIIDTLSRLPSEKNKLADLLKKSELVIEFTHPSTAFENIYITIQHQTSILSGTTGWLDRKKEIDKYCLENQGTFFYATNFSISMQVFIHLQKIFTKIILPHKPYQIQINEIHHHHKKDMPSGTAITLQRVIQESQNELNMKNKLEKIPIFSERKQEDTVGIHSINYTSQNEAMIFTHTAYDRNIYAEGVLLVAEWLKDKKGVFSMKDFLQI